jgi:hypothetical protein
LAGKRVTPPPDSGNQERIEYFVDLYFQVLEVCFAHAG